MYFAVEGEHWPRSLHSNISDFPEGTWFHPVMRHGDTIESVVWAHSFGDADAKGRITLSSFGIDVTDSQPAIGW
jgi:hypothetical protein